MRPGRTGLHPYLDNCVGLSRLPVATISEIRGRTRGAGSESVFATDIRFASEQAVLGQFEVGVGAVPMARLGARSGAVGRWRSCSAAMRSPRPGRRVRLREPAHPRR
jgi:enoyl-CoA hydratase/carnithine racemase